MATIVSSYYRIPSKFPSEQYLSWIDNFLKLTAPRIIFTNQETFPLLKAKIPSSVENCLLVCYELEEFFTSQLIDESGWTIQSLQDTESSHSIPLYKIWNEKSRMLQMGVQMNPFATDYFIWCDIGCFRDANAFKRNPDLFDFPRINNLPQDRILLLEIQPFTTEEKLYPENLDARFQFVNRIGGGIFGGSKQAINTWGNKYYTLLMEMYRRSIFIGKDQSVMAFYTLLFPKEVSLISIPSGYPRDPWFYLTEYLSLAPKIEEITNK